MHCSGVHVLLQYTVACHLPGDLPMFPGLSFLASSVSWKHFLLFFTRTYLGLITGFRIAHLHCLEKSFQMTSSCLGFDTVYKTLKLALQRRLGIELSTQASTKNNTVTKHQNPPSTQPLGLSNTHFLTLDETYALKTHRHLSSFIPASTLTSAVWQNSTKAGLLESKETAQVLWGTTLSCYALHKIKMHFQTHVLSGLLQVSLYFPSAAMFVKCFSRPLYVSLQGYGRDDFAVYYRRVFGIYQVPTFTCMSVSIANQVSSSISASSC